MHSDTVHTKAPADAIVVEDADLLFNGDFKRAGADLVISRDDRELVLSDYFKGGKHAPLASPDGAYLTGNIVDALTGHVQMAQADGSAAAAKIIGHVTKLSGNATAIRNGVSIILNNGDNVHQGDVVQSGSNSTLGITFVDGSVFGLGSNAKMVLNEMVYDPNGSSNSSFLSLVQGTISFVAGATAKHGDMKVDTPVATMGIRGTAVLVEIDFEVTVPGSAPPARFQVLVEPDGTTGSYVLLDRVTLAPIATVNQAGTVTTVSGQGTVSFLASAQLSPEVMKLISEVFSQKFTDNSNPKSNTHFTDSLIPDNTFPVKFAGGENGTATVRIFAATDAPAGANVPVPKSLDHIPGPPSVVAFNAGVDERTLLTGSSLVDRVSSVVSYVDVNAGDVPSVQATFDHFSYRDGAGHNVTSTLTAAQRSAIAAVTVPLVVEQDPQGKNYGSATWTYSVQDHALDFLADGETLTLTYMARVDNNFSLNNEYAFAPITITIIGTNDAPTTASVPQIAAIKEIASPQTHDSTTSDTAAGTVSFKDADLTDKHEASITDDVGAEGTTTGLADHDTLLGWLSLGAFSDSTNGVTGSQAWSFSAEDHYFDYLAEDETVTLTYTIQLDDHHGGTVTQDVVVTVTGSNDAPELAADVSGDHGLHAITERENATNDPCNDTAEGSLTFRDVDLSDTHTVSSSAPVFAWLDSNGHPLPLTLSQTCVLTAASTFTLTPHDSTGTGYGSIDFSYSASDHYFDFLAEGETLTITYEVTVTDEHQMTSTQPVTITVTGTNDAPVAVADIDAGNIVESGHDAYDNAVPGVATTTGDVLANDTDADLTDTHEVIGVAAGAVSGGLSTGVGTAIHGTYGCLVLNADGSWTYTLDNEDPDTNALPEGAQVSDVFSYTQTDHHGGTSTTTLTIKITGTNDEPVANAAPVAATDVNGTPVVEQGVDPGNTAFAGVDTATGNVLTNDYDVDTGDTKTVQGVASGTADGPLTDHVGDTVYGTYGHVTIAANGTWTYTLDNDNPATQALTQDEHVTDVFTYTMHDALGSTSSATLTIDITGTNDAPTVAAALTVSADEGDAAFTRDLLSGASDVDDGETLTLAVADVNYAVDGGASSAAAPAGISIGPDGHTLKVDPTNPAFDHLAEGEQTVIVVSYDIKDAHGATVHQTETVTITGTNDEPAIVGETNPATHGIMAVSPVSIIVEPAGHDTNSLGLDTETFNNRQAGAVSNNGSGTGNFFSTALGATFSSSGHAGIVHGSSSVSAAPFTGPLPGGQDTTNYLSIGGDATETIRFTTEHNAFGLYWGSVDAYNKINFYDGATLVASFSGSEISPLLANGNQGSFSSNGYVEFVLSHDFNKVVLSSSSNAFEVDNISAGVLPIAHAKLVGSVSGTLSVHDPDIGDPLTGLVTGNATVLYNNSATLPNGVNVADLIKAGNITFDSVQSDGGTDTLHWNYDPHGANLDFLHAGDVLKLTYTAQVSDGHGSSGSQQLLVTLGGTDNNTNLSSFKFVDGTSGNDTFSNVGGGATVVGNGGNDTFVFKPASGSATIADFDPATDTISFASSMFNHNAADVLAATHDDGHGNTVIAVNAADTITLQHVLKAQLSASDFHFV